MSHFALGNPLPPSNRPLSLFPFAAVAPWFSASMYKSGAYMTVHKNVGSMIDWVRVLVSLGTPEIELCAADSSL